MMSRLKKIEPGFILFKALSLSHTNRTKIRLQRIQSFREVQEKMDSNRIISASTTVSIVSKDSLPSANMIFIPQTFWRYILHEKDRLCKVETPRQVHPIQWLFPKSYQY